MPTPDIGDTETTKRLLREARRLAAEDSARAAAGDKRPARRARCALLGSPLLGRPLQPATGVALYDELLRDWPRGQTRDAGLYLARLARACVDAGELDRGPRRSPQGARNCTTHPIDRQPPANSASS